MAWNEPGGSGGRDPWGQRGGGDGPPDLDEVLRKLQDRVTGIFGGRRRGGEGRGGGGGGFVAGLVAGVILIIWALSGIYIVREGQQGVELQFGAFYQITDPGFHWYPPLIRRVVVEDVARIRTLQVSEDTRDSLMLTRDQNVVDLAFVVQYHVQDVKKFLFAARNPEESLAHATKSAVRELAGNHDMEYITTEGRAEFARRAQERIQEIVNNYGTGLLVTSFNLQKAQPPRPVIPAYDDVVAANEDRQRYINEAEAYRNKILPEARGQARRIIEDAEAYKQEVISRAQGEAQRFVSILREYERAPKVTRERLYLETLEDILARSSKIMVDVDGDNILYLPLDRMTGGTPPRSSRDEALPPPPPPLTSQGSGNTGSDARDRMRERRRTREIR